MTALPVAPHVCLPCRLGFANLGLLAAHVQDAHVGQPTEPLVFDLPLPPNMLNGPSSRLHPVKKSFKQREYRAACDAVPALPAPPAMPLTRARLEITLRTSLAMDRDGAWARCKWPLDWLVARGYLRDDSPSVIGAPAFTAEKCKRSAAGVRLVLTPETPT